jgi:ABC-type sugar transport system substrate-binding protein
MKYFLMGAFLFVMLFNSFAVSAKPLHFALFSARDTQDAFWGPVEEFAKQAAKQLDVKLSILYSNNSKRNMVNLLIRAKELDVDAIILPNFGKIALHLLKKSEQNKIPLLLFNSDLMQASKKLAGTPQQNFKYWFASLIPNDQQAGYLLGKYLIAQARQKKLVDGNDTVKIIAINGTLADSPSESRLAGLHKAIQEDGNSELLQSVYAFWSQEKASYKASRLSLRYPNAKVYWAGSDLMAIGINHALTEHGLVAGKDYITGGVDWSKEGLSAISQGKISASAGGHFMDGGWAVIMLYDHFNGKALSVKSLYQFQSAMSLITDTEIDLLLPRLHSHDWQGINFRLRSKVFNQNLKEYNFSPASILKELAMQKNNYSGLSKPEH